MPNGYRWLLCHKYDLCPTRRDHILGFHPEEGAVAGGIAGEELENWTWWWVSEGWDGDGMTGEN